MMSTTPSLSTSPAAAPSEMNSVVSTVFLNSIFLPSSPGWAIQWPHATAATTSAAYRFFTFITYKVSFSVYLVFHTESLFVVFGSESLINGFKCDMISVSAFFFLQQLALQRRHFAQTRLLIFLVSNTPGSEGKQVRHC